MQIKTAQYMYGFALPEQYRPLDYPEIAVAGKSNVGKSSFINMLTNMTKLAKVAKTPGKTRMVNIFLLNDAFTLMDLPGYGYAKVSHQEKQRFSDLIEFYLNSSHQLKHVLLLLDIRHAPSADDRTMLNWLHYYHVPFSIIATKADKLSRAQIKKRRLELSRETGIIQNAIYPISSQTRLGKDEVLSRIGEVLAQNQDEQKDAHSPHTL